MYSTPEFSIISRNPLDGRRSIHGIHRDTGSADLALQDDLIRAWKPPFQQCAEKLGQVTGPSIATILKESGTRLRSPSTLSSIGPGLILQELRKHQRSKNRIRHWMLGNEGATIPWDDAGAGVAEDADVPLIRFFLFFSYI